MIHFDHIRFEMRIILLFYTVIVLFSTTLFSSEFFVLPQESEKALSSIIKSIDHSNHSIKITMYNFTHKKIANRLKNAAKRGVKVQIIFDDKSVHSQKRRSMLYYLAKYKNISVYTLKGSYLKSQKRYAIMHLKMALFDHKRVIFGSANWTYSAFGKNFEMLYVIDDYKISKKYDKYFQKLLLKSHKFK